MIGPRWLDWPAAARRLVAALYFLVINWLMLTPSDTIEDYDRFFPNEDKVAHLVVFAVLVVLVRWATAASATVRAPAPGRGSRPMGVLLAALLLYAAAIEALQPVLGGAGRQFDWWDMACNVVGTGGGWLVCGMLASPFRVSQGGSPL